MRQLIFSFFVVLSFNAMGTDSPGDQLAQPVFPEFIRTQLIQAQGATPEQAIQAAHDTALQQAAPPAGLNQPVAVTNHAVALLIRRNDHYYTETWVTVRTRN